ncbi:MAG: hypothetical protein K9K40_09775 [Desulfotignum sp.]|nr:hypothetical protein [Desulfotignum sp.]MCF8125902.1 hypothetical protein [Desulfotignum sp.]
MKLTDPQSIQESERELIDTINAEIDWDVIKLLLMEKQVLNLKNQVDYKSGDLVVYDNQIAYKLDFEIKLPMSVIFSRQGECLNISTCHDDETPEKKQLHDMADLKEKSSEKVEQLASNIANMISEINRNDAV